jgi:ribosomal protein L35
MSQPVDPTATREGSAAEPPPSLPHNVIRIDRAAIESHLGEMVRGTVEQTLNALLDAEADQLCGAKRYERSPDRADTRAGHYERQLHTKAGAVTLRVPKLRSLPFETAIIERYKRREISVEEALVEMYLAGVSVRRVEDITEALWGTRVSPSTVSELNQKIAVKSNFLSVRYRSPLLFPLHLGLRLVLLSVLTHPFRAPAMQKTKKSIAKRYKVTGRGKILRRTPGRRHLLKAKSTKQKRQSGKDKPVSAGMAANIRRALPFAF